MRAAVNSISKALLLSFLEPFVKRCKNPSPPAVAMDTNRILASVCVFKGCVCEEGDAQP